MPAARLLESFEVIHSRRSRPGSDRPTLFGIQRHGVIGGKQDERAGADFLKVVPGQGQGKFGDKRQDPAQTIGTKTVGVQAGARGEADHKVVFPFRKRVGQHGPAPEQVGGVLNSSVQSAAAAGETVAAGVGPKLAFVPDG